MPAPTIQTSHWSRAFSSAGSRGVVSCQTETVSSELRRMRPLGAVQPDRDRSDCPAIAVCDVLRLRQAAVLITKLAGNGIRRRLQHVVVADQASQVVDPQPVITRLQ